MRQWRCNSAILHLGTRWRWVIRFTPRPFYPRRKSPRYPLDGRLGGPHSKFGLCGAEKISCYCRKSNPGPALRSPFLYRVRVRVTLRLAVYRQSVHLGHKPLEDHDQHFFFQLNTCSHSPYITSSLTRGWVCHLQLLLALASEVTLRSESRRTHDHILLSHIRDSSNLEGQVPAFISPRKRVTQL
jgi:hypothetical protein